MIILSLFSYNEDTGLYQLLNRRGKPVKDAYWTEKPKLRSGLFLICESKLFTVLGDEVDLTDMHHSRIINIINFWIIVQCDNHLAIARLESVGLKFRVKCITAVKEIGYLSYDGCVIKINNDWEIYNYSFGTLTVDDTKPIVSFTSEQIVSLLLSGFSTEYLSYLAISNNDALLAREISMYSTMSYWNKANEEFIDIINKISSLVDQYSPDRIGQIMGLRPYVITVLQQYMSIRDFLSE